MVKTVKTALKEGGQTVFLAGTPSVTPQVVKAVTPRVVKAAIPHVDKAAIPQVVKADSPQVIKAASPQVVKAATPQVVKAAYRCTKQVVKAHPRVMSGMCEEKLLRRLRASPPFDRRSTRGQNSQNCRCGSASGRQATMTTV